MSGKPHTQRQYIIKLLKRGWTSPASAFEFGCGMKLASRCSELRGDPALRLDGYELESKWSPDKAYKLYRLIRKPVTQWIAF